MARVQDQHEAYGGAKAAPAQSSSMFVFINTKFAMHDQHYAASGSLLQGGITSTQDELSHIARPAVVLHDQPILGASENQEPSPPPSRILRSGKRIPIGSAVRTAPRTASKANKASVTTADEVPIAQVWQLPLITTALYARKLVLISTCQSYHCSQRAVIGSQSHWTVIVSQ